MNHADLAPDGKGVAPLHMVLQRDEEVGAVLYPRHVTTANDRLALHRRAA